MKNRTRLLLPFVYENEKIKFSDYIKGIDKNIKNDEEFSKNNAAFVLAHVKEILKKVECYSIKLEAPIKEEIKDKEDDKYATGAELSEIKIYYFPTGIGFWDFEIVYSYKFDTTDKLMEYNPNVVRSEEGKDIENTKKFFENFKTDEVKTINKGINSFLQNYEACQRFSEENFFYIFHNAINYSGYDTIATLGEIGNLIFGNDTKNNELGRTFTINDNHQIYITDNTILSRSKMTYSVKATTESNGDTKKECLMNTDAEQIYQKKNESAYFYSMLLLQHERLMLMNCQKKIITLEEKTKRSTLKKLKSYIISCFSTYSFENFSDNSMCQLVYSTYRNKLQLSSFEETTSNIIYKLDDELSQKQEWWMNLFKIILGIAGISSIADIFNYISQLVNWINNLQ